MGWRGDVRDRAKAGLDAFMLANPTLVTHVHSARPAALADTRMIFIGGIAETLRHTSGLRIRIAEVTFVCARHLSENTEAIDDLEDLADAFVDYLTDNPHLIEGNTLFEPVRTTTTEIAEGGTFIPAVAVIARADIQQGRT